VPLSFSKNVLARAVFLLVALLLTGAEGTAQEASLQSSLRDSVTLRVDSETYYSALRLRLIRWLRRNTQAVPIELLNQAVDLLEQADAFAGREDFATALLILDTAFDLSGLGKVPEVAAVPPAQIVATPSSKPANWQWTREVVAGVDYWHQEFELGFSDDDSLYSDRRGNPFTGLRLNLTRGNDSENSFSAHSFLKASRDYASGELETRWRRNLAGKTSGLLIDRLEGTSYSRDLDLKYWQNTSTLQISFAPARSFRVECDDEFRYRGYQHQSSTYPNYLHNRIRFGGSYLGGVSTRIDAAYDYSVRLHPRFSDNDYFEHRIDASIYQATATNSSMYLQNIWRVRDYAGGGSDSTYQNTYQEEHLRGEFRFGLTPRLAIRLDGDYTLRQYEVPSSNTPDFANTFVNPQFVVKILDDWQLSLGYMYLLRVHGKDLVHTDRSPVTDTRSLEAGYVGYEDYNSHGVTLSVELFRISGLMVSINETYEMRTYPNSPTNALPGLGLYTDRNINTLLLFLTYALNDRLQFSAIANLDNDRSRIDNQSDSRSTLFSIDVGYSF